MKGNGPIFGEDLTAESDYGQLFVQSSALALDDDTAEPFLDALDDAVFSGRFVGVAGGLIDIKTPGTRSAALPVRIEVHAGEPTGDEDAWDHEVDVDFDVPDGRVVLTAATCPEVGVLIQPGRYRVRVSGRGFITRGDAGIDQGESYRLRFWPRAADREPALRKRWPGWDGYGVARLPVLTGR